MSAYAKYGTAELCWSSSAVLLSWHEDLNPYAFGMEKKYAQSPFGFGARLKAARTDAKLTQLELGKQAGEHGKDAPKQSISDWEAERYYPKVDQLRVMCLRMGVSADQLIFGDLRQQVAMAAAETAISVLTPKQRQDLLDKMLGPAVSDEVVEEKVPVTRRRANAK